MTDHDAYCDCCGLDVGGDANPPRRWDGEDDAHPEVIWLVPGGRWRRWWWRWRWELIRRRDR